jgi:hypothetical protein
MSGSVADDRSHHIGRCQERDQIMTTVRMLVTGRAESHLLLGLHRAQSALDGGVGDGDHEIVVIAGSRPRRGTLLASTIERDPRVRLVTTNTRSRSHMLDIGLFLRPLPSAVAIVGSGSPWLADMALVAPMLVPAGIGAAVAYDPRALRVDPLMRHGGVFAAGPLCAAGGFVGDGVRPVPERLESIGFATMELPTGIDHAAAPGPATIVASPSALSTMADA